MADNILKVKMQGDISDLEAKLGTAQKSLDNYAKGIDDTKVRISQLNQNFTKLDRELASLNSRYKRGDLSQAQYEKGVKDLTQSFNRNQVELNQSQRELQELQNSYNKVSREANVLQSSVQNVTTSNTGLTRSNKSVQRSSRGTSAAAVEVGRALGDLPFGIQGVANNFQQLAFVMGASGVVQIAIAGVTAGMVALERSGIGLDDVLQKIGITSSSLAADLEKLSDATKDFTSEARSEVSALESLLIVARDESETKKARERAIEEINDKYGEYLGNLDTERIKTDEVTQSINNLSTALIQQSKIRGVQGRIDEIFEEREDTTTELLERRAEAYDELAGQLRFLNASQENIDIDVDSLFGSERDYEAIEKAIEQVNSVLQESDDPIVRQRRLNEGVVGSFANLVNQYELASESSKDYDNETNQLIRSLVKLKGELQSDYFNTLPQAADGVRQIGEAINEIPEPDPIPIEFDIESNPRPWFSFNPDEIDAFYDIVKDIQKVLGEGFTGEGFEINNLETFRDQLYLTLDAVSAVTNGIGSAFRTLGNQISQALIYGEEGAIRFKEVVQSMGAAIIQSLADLAAQWISNQIIQLIINQKQIAGEQAKSQANAVTIASNAASAMGAAGIVALPGLLAGTQATIAAAFAGIQAQQFATGGVVGGGSFIGDKVPILANSGEMILNGRQQRSLFSQLNSGVTMTDNRPVPVEVFGRIKGKDIVLSSDRYNRGRERVN